MSSVTPTPAEIEAERRLRERVRTATRRCRKIPYWQAIRDALREEMLRDPAVFVMGEDVGLYGGAYGATRGLFEEFGPERVMRHAHLRGDSSAARRWARP